MRIKIALFVVFLFAINCLMQLTFTGLAFGENAPLLHKNIPPNMPIEKSHSSHHTIKLKDQGGTFFSLTFDCFGGWGADEWELTLTKTSEVTIGVQDCCCTGDFYEVYVADELIGTTPNLGNWGCVTFGSLWGNPAFLSSGSFKVTLKPGVYLIKVRDASFQLHSQFEITKEFMCPAGYSVNVGVKALSVTLSVLLDPASVRPSGLLEPQFLASGDYIDAPLPRDDETTAIIRITGAIPNTQEQVIVTAEGVADSGSHKQISHISPRPTGALFVQPGIKLVNPISIPIKADGTGVVKIIYRPTPMGGQERIKVKLVSSGQVASATLDVLIPNLLDYHFLASPPGMTFAFTQEDPATAERRHGLQNLNFMEPLAARKLVDALKEFRRQLSILKYPVLFDFVSFNDMSLPRGGRFDVAGNWSSLIVTNDQNHRYHRTGRSVDINSNWIIEKYLENTLKDALGKFGFRRIPEGGSIHFEFTGGFEVIIIPPVAYEPRTDIVVYKTTKRQTERQ